MLFSKSFRPSWIGLAAALFAAVLPGRVVRADNIVGDAVPALDGVATEGSFRHLRAFQDIASVSGGNRAAGTLRAPRQTLRCFRRQYLQPRDWL